MKKILVLLLAAVMCLSLCACGGSENNPNTNNSTTQPQIEHTPTETTTPHTEPEDTEPPETEPVYETIEITLDNWQDYFEFREVQKIKFNGFDEFDGADVLYYLVSKDRIEFDRSNSSITIECILTTEYKPYSVDLENKTIVYGEATDTKVGDPRVEDLDTLTIRVGEDTESRYGKFLGNVIITDLQGDNVRHIVSIEITRITGSFCILKDR